MSDDATEVSDTPIPVPAPRAAMAASAEPVAIAIEKPDDPKEVDETLPPYPVARPLTVRGSTDAPTPTASVVSAVTERLNRLGGLAIRPANAAESEPDRAPLFEASFTTDDTTRPTANSTIDEAVERRDVKAIEGCVNDVFRTCPRTTPSANQRSSSSAAFSTAPAEELATATAGLMRAAVLDPRTLLWLSIGFAALLGLFISARRSSD